MNSSNTWRIAYENVPNVVPENGRGDTHADSACNKMSVTRKRRRKMRWTEDAELTCHKLKVLRGVSVNAAVRRHGECDFVLTITAMPRLIDSLCDIVTAVRGNALPSDRDRVVEALGR